MLLVLSDALGDALIKFYAMGVLIGKASNSLSTFALSSTYDCRTELLIYKMGAYYLNSIDSYLFTKSTKKMTLKICLTL